MASAYPGAIDTFATRVDGVDFVLASHMNGVQEGVVAAQTAIGQEGNSGLVEGRLTLTTGVPRPTADVALSTTVYFAPLDGARLALHNGTGWITHIFSQLSLTVPNTLNTMYDVFVYSNAGTPTLEALAWTNDTTRATALTTLDGVPVKTGATTRRYLGSFRTTGVSGNTVDKITQRFLWNYYNRIPRLLARINTTGHTYATAAWRAWNNDAPNSQVEIVVGEAMNALGIYRANNTAGTPAVAFGLNSIGPGGAKGEQFNNVADVASSDQFTLAAGYNYWVAVQYGGASGTYERVSMTMQIEG